MASLGLLAQTACIWEATARKPGNVHRYADFDDLTYRDFLLSAAAIAPVFDRAPGRAVGETVLDAIQATRQVVTTNTNLGIVLLLAPLAAVPVGRSLHDVLASTTVEDARNVYEAIRLASPGGLGEAPEQDVRQEPTRTLTEVMALATERDQIAAQYGNDFFAVREILAPGIAMALDRWGGLELAIVATFLAELADGHDSLIVRKRGVRAAEEVRRKAVAVFEAGWPDTPSGWEEFHTFDTWLREPAAGRNPGTSADLIAASLFLLLREGTIPLPSPYPWSAGWQHD